MPEILKRKENNVAAEAYFRTAMSKEPYNYNIYVMLQLLLV
jgi:hypothetical protein